ncbi:testis-expressed protein 19 [Sorex araneus]|uniref:testis-expressed protein 19 n=1 Tax=Sorex araneus TaxID=42254 RepID=UPI000331671F|nr:testis-expressed protein 19 [Sorex araneus]
MCPPVSARHSREGVSYLHAFWLYQFQHGAQLKVCFTCFKAAFLEFRDSLEADDWDEDDWDPEPGSPEWGGAEQAAALGMMPSWGQPAQAGSQGWGPGLLASTLAGLEQESPEHFFVPTELEPQDATPLELGPEDADWTQGLPWRLGMLPVCPHWPVSPTAWLGFFRGDRDPGESMLLELGSSQAMEPGEAEAWLLDLQLFSLVTCSQSVYFRKMRPGWVQRTQAQSWTVLLEPAEVCLMRLKDTPQEFDAHKWKLSVLESPSAGYSAELVPADVALLKKGFTILSYSPSAQQEEEQGATAHSPPPCTPAPDPPCAQRWCRESGEPQLGGAASFPGPHY